MAGRATSAPPNRGSKKAAAFYERLAEARYIATYRVALHLLYQTWKRGGQPVLLPNGPLIAEGIALGTKWRALKELERLGLITIERRKRKAPRITALFVNHGA